MIPTYDQMGDWLDEIAGQFPEAFFKELDGGVRLEKDALEDKTFPPGRMYIMGQYCHNSLGRYVLLYYGSFVEIVGNRDEATWREKIFAIVAHEFTHHMEESAGLHALEDKDEEFMRRAKAAYEKP